MLATSCGNAATRASSEVVGGSSGNTISLALLPPSVRSTAGLIALTTKKGERARQDSNLRVREERELLRNEPREEENGGGVLPRGVAHRPKSRLALASENNETPRRSGGVSERARGFEPLTSAPPGR